MSLQASTPLIGFGQVRHARLRPEANAFAYPTYFLLLPLRRMHREGSPVLAHNRTGALSFFDSDHGDGGDNALLWLDALLRRDGSLRAIVVEVNNTFGERHCYLLENPAFGAELRTDKAFHVSPFCAVEGGYRFRFLFSGDGRRTVARIDYDDSTGPLLKTSVSGTLEPATRAALRRALWRHPAMTLMVVARIHWQALRLFFKRVRFFTKPAAPDLFVTR
jgi:uncharacterized protein